MMTTEGGMSYRDIMLMDEPERLWWLQKCMNHNDKIQEDTSKAKTRRK